MSKKIAKKSPSKSHKIVKRLLVARNETVRMSKAVARAVPELGHGFVDGRQYGNDIVRHGVPYLAGGAAGVTVGVSEALISVAACPARLVVNGVMGLFGLVFVHEDEIELETA